MDYASYKQFRNELLKEERRFVRLDCMNPIQALAAWTTTEPEQNVTARPAQAVAAWSKATGIELDPERTVVGRGVRELLSATFSCALKRKQELWLPEDVYPVYWELASHAELELRAFATLPGPNWNFLAQTNKRAAIVLPAPLSPIGRWPTDAEISAILSWLSSSRHRLLIIDAVYTFDFDAGHGLTDLFLTETPDQCIVLWSCAKSWLSPGALGIASVPRGFASRLRSHVSPPFQATLGRIKALLENRPDLPGLQQEAFGREWQRLATRIRSAAPHWQPPPTGYFSVVAVPFETLLDKQEILSVPASVFGGHDELSVVTCLHDLGAQRKDFPSHETTRLSATL